MDVTSSECFNASNALTDEPTPDIVVKTVALGMIDLAVVLGNSLVIAAVLTTRKLRTVTNIFIVSLACADLLLGFAVLPFSISIEVVDVWLWGQIWCSMWLAIDVWLCTASILSLCAISLDRFVAVTHPIRYPSIMSPFRGRVLVSLVWILSFVICLPPLLGWNDGGESEKKYTNSFHNRSTSNLDKLLDSPPGSSEDTLFNLTAAEYFDGLLSNISLFMNKSDTCNLENLTCELTPTKGYRIYAAMGSFFIPALVMVFFYFRIYLTAVRTAASIRKGVLTTRASSELAHHNGIGDDEIHLRVHRGGGSSRYSSCRSYDWKSASQRILKKERQESAHLGEHRTIVNATDTRESNGRAHLILKDDKTLKANNGNCVKWSHNIFKPIAKQFKRSKEKSYIQSSEEDSTEMEVLNSEGKSHSLSKPNSLRLHGDSPNNSPAQSLKRSPRRIKLLIREGKATSSIKGHARKFKREAKAAKTLAIIVGAFIVCWCPFFTIYLLGAFCQGCVSDIVFAVFFWLGYCNSALNPCIYALFARDFRSAFKRLLFCKRRKGLTHATRADYITGTRNRMATPLHDNDSTSDF
ncbi:octopamine receptor 1-like [Mercenaria mercenaria]|uniref:octopamine receptor 1-like n=1 Tax=Mercenaria mercenaria TaxID=6596 RepID=UPI00234F0ED2|nr:octopamine receptor 1-like [Mercenaria mercenaria]